MSITTSFDKYKLSTLIQHLSEIAKISNKGQSVNITAYPDGDHSVLINNSNLLTRIKDDDSLDEHLEQLKVDTKNLSCDKHKTELQYHLQRVKEIQTLIDFNDDIK